MALPLATAKATKNMPGHYGHGGKKAAGKKGKPAAMKKKPAAMKKKSKK